MATTILLVEDERKLRELVRSYLERGGFTVLSTGSGAEALSLAGTAAPDLVILDLGLPDVPGETVARELRSVSGMPILMLTAKSSEEDRIRGLEMGADDYVTKPFSPRELVLRCQAILRRGGRVDSGSAEPASYGEGALVIDEQRRSVEIRGTDVSLTPTEWGVLVALATVPGRVYSRYEIINRTRGYEFDGYERSVDSHVKNLRRKIEVDAGQPEIIQTVLGGGYRLGLNRDGWRGNASTVGMRLSLAFVSVALAAVALLAVLTAIFAANDVDQLSQTQRGRLARAVGAVVTASRAETGHWSRADLEPITDLTARVRAQLSVWDAAGIPVLVTPGFASDPGPVERMPVIVGKQRVGTVAVRFRGEISQADARLRTQFRRAIAGAAGLAALLALLVAIAMSRRITRPVVRLIEAADAVGGGDVAARVGSVRGPVELVDLARTFDKMAAELAGQEQLRRVLVADVAHELRTPVAILQAGHEALLDGVVPATPAQLASLRDEVMRLARMVDDLQVLAAAEAAALQLTLRPTDLAEIAGAACGSLAGHFESSQLTLDCQLDPAPVRADSRWMHQVITNLLGNAAKFTPAGGRVTVSTGTDGDQARLTVADTGIGIAPDKLPHIFDRFWRGSNPMRAAGSGIGLAIVAELVRGHDGVTEVSSTLGGGAAFVSLPRA